MGRERGARSDLVVHFVLVVLPGVLLDQGARRALGDLRHRLALEMYPERQTREPDAQDPMNMDEESLPTPVARFLHGTAELSPPLARRWRP